MSLSKRAYARHRGCDEKAVRVAILEGRLTAKSVTKAGKIRSAKAADAEWAANTKADYVPLTGPTAPASAAPTPTATPSKAAAAVPPPDLATARARKENANAHLAELELAERRERLVDAREVERTWVTLIHGWRTKLLGIAARVAQRDPTFTRPQLALIEADQRGALEDMAEGKEIS